VKEKLDEEAGILVVQRHQLDAAGLHVGKVGLALELLGQSQQDNDALLDQMLAQAGAMLESRATPFDIEVDIDIDIDTGGATARAMFTDILLDPALPAVSGGMQPLGMLDSIAIDRHADWKTYVQEAHGYADRNDIRLDDDPFRKLMSDTQRIALEKRIKEEFSLKNAQCDKYDYMIAGTCGLIGGLIDIFFVGLPGEGKLGQLADGFTDKLAQGFAKANGWPGPKQGSDPVASAIGFLEKNFKVNYDHRHGGDVGAAFDMSTKNHHVKSLAHSPDLVGLFFSLLAQFTSTAHFVSDGRLITIDTKTFELQGSNLVSKLFAGFTNWLGHLVSDMAGSSGAKGRGSGIPMPFYSLLQFVNIGEFGQHRQSFATVAVKVFEQGYDLRHGMALSIPVLVTELLTRVMWSVKRAFYHREPLLDCVPLDSNPELRRMLMVAHGSLCLVDGADAALRSYGDIVNFMLRSNLVAWARFGTLALRELRAWYAAGSLDTEAVDDYLDREYRRMMA
jgi:hypothetical protein